jgi:hypothetical protein
MKTGFLQETPRHAGNAEVPWQQVQIKSIPPRPI